MSERDLVERCRRGDQEARRELYERTSERLYRLLLRMTFNPDDAFDLAQETYVKAFTRIDQFDGRSSVATWLYRIAVNEALQHVRRSAQFRAKFWKIVPDTTTEPDEERSARRLDVDDALARLSSTDRAILLLRYQEGLDYRAIAEVLDCAPGTVGSRLNRARDQVRTILRKSYASREETNPTEHPSNGGRGISSDAGSRGVGEERDTDS